MGFLFPFSIYFFESEKRIMVQLKIILAYEQLNHLGSQSNSLAALSLHWVPEISITTKILLVPTEVLHSPLYPALDRKKFKSLQKCLQWQKSFVTLRQESGLNRAQLNPCTY
jgi:hypothetical protein